MQYESSESETGKTESLLVKRKPTLQNEESFLPKSMTTRKKLKVEEYVELDFTNFCRFWIISLDFITVRKAVT